MVELPVDEDIPAVRIDSIAAASVTAVPAKVLVTCGRAVRPACCEGAGGRRHQGRAVLTELAVPSAMGSKDRSCRLVWLSVPGTAV